ncbi:hypothetical protein [Stenoxybacter acetivorans]|uniref:hypothetical protein n=1 Tax=Stenoxybacter acetivorans TaxID=422441 RepID=UPI0012EB3956|nr:hypothetical protein [Stenoxybacter acetivorans]
MSKWQVHILMKKKGSQRNDIITVEAETDSTAVMMAEGMARQKCPGYETYQTVKVVRL